MTCPECKSDITIEKVAENTYLIECTSISCYWSDMFDYVAQEDGLTTRADYATVAVAG